MPVRTCPLITNTCQSLEERREEPKSVIRAYKLSRQRWSYNCCQLDLSLDNKPLKVLKAVEGTSTLLPAELQECAIAFKVELEGGYFIALHVYLVYDSARELTPVEEGRKRFEWLCVSREDCTRGCKGPLLHSVQRYGLAGGRRAVATNSPGHAKSTEHLYISVDEAASHVGVQHFRLIFGAFSPDGSRLLGAACSMPVKVIANNDVPQGPSTFHVHIPLSQSPSLLQIGPDSRRLLSTATVVQESAAAQDADDVSQQLSVEVLKEMMNSEEGRRYAMCHNAAPVLLLMHACSSCQINEASTNEDVGMPQILDWKKLEKNYPDEIRSVKAWCEARNHADHWTSWR